MSSKTDLEFWDCPHCGKPYDRRDQENEVATVGGIKLPGPPIPHIHCPSCKNCMGCWSPKVTPKQDKEQA